jgi:hypothetical protein
MNINDSMRGIPQDSRGLSQTQRGLESKPAPVEEPSKGGELTTGGCGQCVPPDKVESAPVKLRAPAERLQQTCELTIEAALLVIAHNKSTQYFNWMGQRFFYRKEELFIYFIQESHKSKPLRTLSDAEREKALKEYSSQNLSLKLWWIQHTIGTETGDEIYGRLQFNLGEDKAPHWLPDKDEARYKKQDALQWLEELGDMERNPELWEMVLRLNSGADPQLKRSLESITKAVNGWSAWLRDTPSDGWTPDPSGELKFTPALNPIAPRITCTVIELNLERVSQSIGKGEPTKAGEATFRPKKLVFNHDWPKNPESPVEDSIKSEQDLANLQDSVKNFLKPVGEGVKIILRGYADRSGTRAYNEALSQKRAEWVKKRLEAALTPPPTSFPVKYDLCSCGDRFADQNQLKHEPSRVVVVSIEPGK